MGKLRTVSAAAAVVTTLGVGLSWSLMSQGADSGQAEASPQRLPVYLHGYRQSQLLCPGGELTGRVSSVVVDPLAAVGQIPGDCTLADMKNANPDADFYAYVDIAAMRAEPTPDAVFRNTCLAADEEGQRFAVVPANDEVAVDGQGRAVYPDYDHLVVADLSVDYAAACAESVGRMLSTPSEPSVVADAAAAHFDGVFFDDANLSPAHQQDMADIGSWGPWSDDSDYGRALIDVLGRVNSQLESTVDREVPIMVNLGMRPWEPEQVDLAVRLARTGSVDTALRELTTATNSGAPLGEQEMLQIMQAHRLLAEGGLTIIQHDYSVPLRDVATELYEQRVEIPASADCLLPDDPKVDAVRQVADERRRQDFRFLLAHTLMSRSPQAPTIYPGLPQAEPFCQTAEDGGPMRAETVTEASIPDIDQEAQSFLEALSAGASATGDVEVEGKVLVQALSTGQTVVLNTGLETADAAVNGVYFEVPARSAILVDP